MTPSLNLHENLLKLGKFSLSCFTTTVIKMLLNLAKNAILTRLLGPEARGAFGLLNATPSLVVSFGNLGFGLGTVFLVTQKKAELGVITGNALLYSMLHGILLACFGALFIYYEDSVLGVHDHSMTVILPFMIAGIPVLLAQNTGFDLLLGTQDIHYMNMINITATLLPIAGILVFWFITGDLLLSASWAWLGSMAVVSILAFTHVIRRSASLHISIPLMKEAFSFGLRGNISQFANAIVRRVDILFLSHYHGMKEVGFYAAAVSISELLLTLPSSIAEPFMPIVMGMERDDGAYFSSMLIKYVFTIMSAICLLLALFCKPILLLMFGKEFLPSLAPLLWLLPGMLPLALYQFLKADMYRLNHPGLLSWVSVIAMAVNLLLNFLLIPRYGTSGAAIASSISYTISTGLLFICYCRLTGIPAKNLLLLNKNDMDLIKNTLFKILKRSPEKD